jgi:DNA polymerase III sliding clamp (beta) subunit (PCNA family)
VTFPNCKKATAISANNTLKATLPIAELVACLRRMQLVANEVDNNSIVLHFANDQLAISAQHARAGDCNETIDCDVDFELKLGLNVAFVLDFLALFKTGYVKFEMAAADAPLLLRPTAPISGVVYNYMLMPVRL